MASGADSKELEPSNDLDSSLVLRTEEVTYNRKVHVLTVTHKGVKLTPKASQDPPILDLLWQDVVCACPAQSAKSKSSNGEEDKGGSFVIHYVMKKAKSNHLRCHNLILALSEGTSQEWIKLIEERRKEGKPRKLLIIINPIGGKGQGRQVFEKQVRPLFDLAGIESIVKVTDHFRHAEEIAKNFELTSVDGVVVSGGDGFYTEVLQGMMLQTLAKIGVNPDDPESPIVPPPVPIALIPTGTGNGVSGWINGDVVDVVTSALNVVRGAVTRVNVMTIHDAGRLVHYCGLRLAYGFFAQIMKRTDALRWMKRARYPYAILASVFWEKYLLDIDLEILQESISESALPPMTQSSQTPDSADPAMEIPPAETQASGTKGGWVKVGARRVSNLTAWVAELQSSASERLVFNPFSRHLDLILQTSTSGTHHLAFLTKMVTRNKNMFDSPSVERFLGVQGFRFRFTGQRSEGRGQGEGASGGLSEREVISRALDSDGELMDSDVTSVECRLHHKFLPVFGIEYVPT